LSNVHPLVFEPIYKPRIWGGRRIFSHFGRKGGPPGAVGESWELADLEEDQTRVAVGPARGRLLSELVATWGRDLMGGVSLVEGRFPLLIKFLDAADRLSVQVHPSEAVAGRLGGAVRVKHEAWYVLAAEPGAVIYHGLQSGVDVDGFHRAMLEGQAERVLRAVPARPGSCYYLPSGTPHALGAGVLVAEVQTPSDVTYRAYDWGRIDPETGRPRDLHLEQAIECIDFSDPSPPPEQERSHVASLWTAVTRLVACPSFVIEKVRMVEGAEQAIPYAEPVVWMVLEGRGEIEWRGGGRPLEFGGGNVILLPAALPDGRVRILSPTKWLEVTVPVASSLAGYDRPAPEDLAPPGPAEGLVQIRLPPAGSAG
jgi:mannose-6-phosphate isomerase